MTRAEFLMQFVNKQDLESSRLAFKRDAVQTKMDEVFIEIIFKDGSSVKMPNKAWEWVRGW